MAKIAVTGAAGTIGAPLCADLSADHEVVRIDRTGVAKPVDVLDLSALEAAVAGCETVIHLAGYPNVSGSWAETRENIDGTYNAFEAARRAGCKRVIFASSNHAVGLYEVKCGPGIYEPAAGLLVRNDSPLRPDSLYG
ncbi:MAG: NAD(P)-dependent oxidoreductase, partial [Candidatus Eremiobacteraeota bacterium]|nr:NAD(P)-dependent oxidoreductase [Candidatus Eremiobacteraeota bacterium]